MDGLSRKTSNGEYFIDVICKEFDEIGYIKNICVICY